MTAGELVRKNNLSGQPVVVVSGRQKRPNVKNVSNDGCPFCPGGLEAPEEYEVHWFKNRWPPLPDGRCEVILFSPDHHASLGSLEIDHLEMVVDLWTERMEELGSRPDVKYVLIFENRGADVGATIPHPHGQIYAFDSIPPAPAYELGLPPCEICSQLADVFPGGGGENRLVVEEGSWAAWSVWAPAYPFELLVAPREHLGSLSEAKGSRRDLAFVLQSALGALDGLFDEPMPYMLWCHQKPTDSNSWPAAHLHFHVAPIRRAKGVTRYVAAGELGSGIMFNPVDPEDAAAQLRDALAKLRRAPTGPSYPSIGTEQPATSYLGYSR